MLTSNVKTTLTRIIEVTGMKTLEFSPSIRMSPGRLPNQENRPGANRMSAPKTRTPPPNHIRTVPRRIPRGYRSSPGITYPRAMTIHSDHPFVPDPADRDETRRFRGRLPSPVTIVTAGTQDEPRGLTVSSLMVIEGDQPTLHVVIGPTTDLWYAIEETKRFVVHICLEGHGPRSDVFAGIRPSPGGPFAAVESEVSEWGPVIADIGNRAYCREVSMTETGYSGLVSAEVEKFELTEMTSPLVYFRGSYRTIV